MLPKFFSAIPQNFSSSEPSNSFIPNMPKTSSSEHPYFSNPGPSNVSNLDSPNSSCPVPPNSSSPRTPKFSSPAPFKSSYSGILNSSNPVPQNTSASGLIILTVQCLSIPIEVSLPIFLVSVHSILLAKGSPLLLTPDLLTLLTEGQ